MPLIKIDYSEKILDKDQMKELLAMFLKESMRIYNYDEDKVSIFTAAYGDLSASTAAAEIEVRAKLAEYDKPGQDKNEVRSKHLAEYKKYIKAFVKKHSIPKGIIFTITFEDWQVEWISGSDETNE